MLLGDPVERALHGGRVADVELADIPGWIRLEVEAHDARPLPGKPSATASPMPDPAPITTAVFPVRSNNPFVTRLAHRLARKRDANQARTPTAAAASPHIAGVKTPIDLALVPELHRHRPP